MAPYTGKVTIESGYVYAPYVPINVRGTPWYKKKVRFAFFPKKLTNEKRTWLKSYVRLEKQQYGPLEYPPLTLYTLYMTPEDYTLWALRNANEIVKV